jgi:hypothetical protein
MFTTNGFDDPPKTDIRARLWARAKHVEYPVSAFLFIVTFGLTCAAVNVWSGFHLLMLLAAIAGIWAIRVVAHHEGRLEIRATILAASEVAARAFKKED